MLILLVYCIAGTISQKVLRVDEIFPFFGWSLFTKVPNVDHRYEIVIHRHRRQRLDPPVPYLRAPESVSAGNPYFARKLIQKLRGVRERRPGGGA